MKILKSLLPKNVYVKVYENRFVLKVLEEGALPVTVNPTESFTTNRLLVGQFAVAESALRKGIKDAFRSRWLSASPVVLIHPIEKVEGGLSEVEERVFRELAASAGARKVVVWTGPELSDAEAERLVSKI